MIALAPTGTGLSEGPFRFSGHPKDGRARHLPTAVQTLILKAALIRGEKGRAAWMSWLSGGGAPFSDPALHQALPLLYPHLRDWGETHPLVRLARFQYAATLHHNGKLLEALAGLLPPLHASGIPTLLLKGAAMILLYYADPGVRTMADIDLLIPAGRAREATAIFERLGWHATKDVPEIGLAPHMIHAIHFANEAGLEMDLHFHVFHERLSMEGEDDFWEGARTFRFQSLEIHALCPPDLLLHILVHGARDCDPPAMRWVLDAMTVLDSEQGAIEWNRFIDMARRHRQVLPAREGLAFLAKSMEAPIPEAVFEALADAPVSIRDRLEHKAFHRSFYHRSPLQMFLRLYLPFTGIRRNMSKEAKPVSFAGYVREEFGVRSAWHLPFFLCYKGIRRWCIMLARRLGG